MRIKIINQNVVPYADGEFLIQYQDEGGEGYEGFSGTLDQAIAHGAAEGEKDGAERVSVWGHENINGNVLSKVGAMIFPA